MNLVMIEIGENLLTAIIILSGSTVFVAMCKYAPKIIGAKKGRGKK